MRFFVGVHRPRMGWPLSLRGHPVCISANVLAGRTGNVAFVGQSEGWMLDSGAFTQIALRGRFDQSPQAYAALVRQFGDWHGLGLEVAVSQDWMCEPDVIAATGLSVREHQQLTLDRFDAIAAAGTGRTPLMAVLQGWHAADYRRHLDAYGDRLDKGAWVGVGSVCKRQGDPRAIGVILETILRARPDLRLHGFGVKLTALQSPAVRSMLYSADSMAWSYAARRSGRDQNDWMEAYLFAERIAGRSWPMAGGAQPSLF
jgi:hypothetical protein